MSSFVNYNHEYRRNRISEPAQLVNDANIFTPTSGQKYMLGCIHDLNDGRKFRYLENGGSGLSKGLMSKGAQINTDWETVAVIAAASVGDQKVTISTELGTALVAHDLDNGWLVTEDLAGETELYLIKEHTIGTTPVLTLADEGGIRTALEDTTSVITLKKNIYKDVVVATVTNRPTGVPLVDVDADYFFWAQVRGLCPMLLDAAAYSVVAGDMVGQGASAGTAGAAGIVDASAATAVIYGYCITAAAQTAGNTIIVDLTLE